MFRITPHGPVKIIPADSRISQSVSYRKTLKIQAKNPKVFLFRLQSGSNAASKNTRYVQTLVLFTHSASVEERLCLGTQ